jgi:AraC-like DNA-binding protein
MAVHTVLKKGWVILLMPLNRQAAFVFNGHPARPFDLCLSTGRDGYMTTGKDRHNVAIIIRKARLTSACAALAGVGADDVALRDRVLAREEYSGPRLYRALCDVVTPSYEEPLSEGQFSMPQVLENDLISMLAAQLVPAVRRVPEPTPYRVDALRVVRAAIAASKALPAASLADLCAAAGVGQRWLHKSFVEVLDVSPYRYLRLARLSKARDLLLASEAKPALVKCVALSFGYRLSGRFAAEYRSVFGENPSETLQGSRNI